MSDEASRMQHRLEYLRGKSPTEQVRIVTQALKRRAGLSRSNPVIPPMPAPAAPPERLISRPSLRVAGILDHFSHAAFQYEFRFESLLFDTWREQMEEFQPHLLFVESAWRGELDSWRYLVAGLDGPHPDVESLVSWCRDRDVPTVFWNKEDPPNYLWFIGAAKLFDQVFTVDEGSLPRYAEDLGHERTQVLPFAAQPRIHHPLTAEGERGVRPVAFAGTYYRQKYPERRRQMEVVLDPARTFDLDIYTRVASDGNYRWPKKFEKHIVGTLPYDEMVEAYKRYKVFLNVGSVADSSTMCPRRIFELLASATVVVSSDLKALDLLNGTEGLVRASSPRETRGWLERLLGTEGDLPRRQVDGLHEVLERHTYGERVGQVLAAIGMDDPMDDRRTLSVLCHLRADVEVARVEVAAQAWNRADAVERIVFGGPGCIRLSSERLPPSVAVIAGGHEPGSWLRESITATSTSHVSRFDAQHTYEPAAIDRALRSFGYADIGAVGKGAFESEGGGFRQVLHTEREFALQTALHPDTIIVSAETATEFGLPGPGASAANFCRDLRSGSVRWASTDRYGFVEGTT